MKALDVGDSEIDPCKEGGNVDISLPCANKPNFSLGLTELISQHEINSKSTSQH